MKVFSLKSMVLLSFLLLGTACDSAEKGSGSLEVLLTGDSTISRGLEPGEKPENIHDGWKVRYNKYMIHVGHVLVKQVARPGQIQEDESAYVVDLLKIPSTSLSLWGFPELEKGAWEFHFSNSRAGEGAIRDEGVSEADFDVFQREGLSYWIEGRITKDGGLSCPPKALAERGDKVALSENKAGDPCYSNESLSFRFQAKDPTEYGPCDTRHGHSGFSISAKKTETIAITIHGEHTWFNGFPEGDESRVFRLLQWLSDSDLNLDGFVDQEELAQIHLSELAEFDERYQMGGSPISPLETVWDYVRATLKSQGHVNGESHCAIDGKHDGHH